MMETLHDFIHKNGRTNGRNYDGKYNLREIYRVMQDFNHQQYLFWHLDLSHGVRYWQPPYYILAPLWFGHQDIIPGIVGVGV